MLGESSKKVPKYGALEVQYQPLLKMQIFESSLSQVQEMKPDTTLWWINYLPNFRMNDNDN